MTAKNSGAHLVIEISAEMFSDLIRKFLLGTEVGLGLACRLWPSPSAVIELRPLPDGVASFGATLADGTNFDLGISLKGLLDTFVDLQTKSQLRLSNLGLSDAQLDRIVQGLTFQEKLDILLQDFLPQRTSPTGAIEPVSLAELLTGSLDVVIGGYELRVVGNGAALAIGIFFARAQPPHSAALANQDEAVFANFVTDFLNGQRFGVAVSTELIDRFVLHRPEVEAALRQALPPELYTPADPAHFVTLTAEPPNRFKLSGRGEFQTEDCGGVDADWWVFVEPFIQDGFLKIRAEYDYDTDFEDGVQVVFCVLGNVLAGAVVGFLAGGLIGMVVGGILNFPDLLGGAGAGTESWSSTSTSCGDNCFEITLMNPVSADGRLVFPIGEDESLAAIAISIDETGLSVVGDAVLTFKTSALQITDLRPWIHATAQSACGGGQVQYQAASFMLVNPHEPYETEFEWPQICSISLSENLREQAEVFLMPQNVPPDGPFRVHGVHQQRVEIRLKPGVVAANAIDGSAIIKTNTSPTTRTVPIRVTADAGGMIEVTPLVLEFEQRDEEFIDLRGLRRRNMCSEPIPPRGNLRSVGASFQIRNTGQGLLHICDLVLTDPNNVFQLDGQRTFSLLAGSRIHVPLVLNMNAVPHQQYTATVSVFSTDPNQPQVDVTVRATALTPPQGINVGGQIVVVDNLINAACLELVFEDGPVIDIPLDKWIDIFTDPPLEDPGSVDIFEIGIRDIATDLGLTITDGQEVFVEARLGGELNQSLTLLTSHMKTAMVKRPKDGAGAHFHVSSYAMSRKAEISMPAKIDAVWASAGKIVVGTTDELLLLSIADGDKPKQVGALRDLRVTRIAGKELLRGVSSEGLVIFSIAPELKFRSVFEVKDALDLALRNDSLVYLLTGDSLLTVDLSMDEVNVVSRLKLDGGDEQILALRSGLYLFGNERLTRFDLERPWLPRLAGSTKLRNAKSISHWGSNITATGPKGTQFLAPTADGNVVRFAQYAEQHWGNAFVADRHHRYLLNVDTDGRTLALWRPRVRKIRLSERRGLRERLNNKGRSE